MRRVILDTNFLLIPEQFRVDIFSEINRIADFPHELCILDRSVEELNRLVAAGGKPGRQASVALLLVRKYGIDVVKTASPSASVDSLIVECASDGDLVATQDADLKRRLREKGIAVVTMRNKSFLCIVGF